MIAPITVELWAYGQKGNISKIRKLMQEHMEEECETVPADAIHEMEPARVADEILARLWDKQFALLKLSKSHEGVHIVMPDVHERFTVELLTEMQVAKTCVLLACWHSENEGADHQLLYLKGEQWADSQ